MDTYAYSYSSLVNATHASLLLATPTSDSLATPTSQPQLYYVPVALVALMSLLYGSISVITVVGNALVVIVVLRNKHMQTVANFYIANLSVADIILGVFSIPFQFQVSWLAMVGLNGKGEGELVKVLLNAEDGGLVKVGFSAEERCL